MSQPIFEDGFDAPDLEESRWLPHYLPHWSYDANSRARYAISDSVLRLRIDADQPPWCPAHDGNIRVSNLQTGHFSGPLGSSHGQHRFTPGLEVVNPRPAKRLFVRQHFRLELCARAKLPPGTLAALWLIGFEDTPDHSGEITVMEIFGDSVKDGTAAVGQGIKAITDPRLRDEFFAPRRAIDVSDWHLYAMDWQPDGIRFFLDGKQTGESAQSPDYPMQLMLNFYDLSGRASGPVDGWFDIDHIRAYAD